MKHAIIIWILALGLVSCSGGGGGGGSEPPIPPAAPLAGTPTLTIPSNNQPCSIFTPAAESGMMNIAFNWTAAENASRYEIQIFQNASTVANKTISGTQTTIALAANANYSWSVRAINADGIKGTPSQEFSFYAPAEALVNTVPYALIELNFDSATDTASLSWQGIDPDPDAQLIYDVNVLEDGLVIISLSGTTSTSIADFVVFDGLSYQIIIKTSDENGTSTTSTETKTFRRS